MIRAYESCCDEASLAGLEPATATAFQNLASDFWGETGEKLVVTGAARSLLRQAQLMNAMSNEQLLSLYGSHGIPDYITQIIQARQNAPNGSVSDLECHNILQNRKEGYISRHLQGKALDLRLTPAALKNRTRLEELCQKWHFRLLDEQSMGIPCLHLSYFSDSIS